MAVRGSRLGAPLLRRGGVACGGADAPPLRFTLGFADSTVTSRGRNACVEGPAGYGRCNCLWRNQRRFVSSRNKSHWNHES